VETIAARYQQISSGRRSIESHPQAQQAEVKIIMPPRVEDHIASSGGGMRRVDSEASFVSVPEDGPVKDYRDYRVRKSSLIG